jgi:crotonobetainyl-CoA:carnitine CoA-transferase CaiB-like acyl-CoA transferase
VSTPLSNLLVVSLEQAVAAPYCSSRLADAGARVIKIERADGDFARGYDTAAKGLSSYFVWLNRGKQSLVADIKQPADAALLHRILARADVFIENLAPGAAARAGFGSDELRGRYPRLITVDISGYGETGDYASMKAYDLLVQAESGLAMVTGLPAGPGRVGVSACDIACGMAAHAGVLEALIERGITGRGKGLKVSLFDGMADWMNVPLLFYEGTGRAPERLGLAHPSICPYGAFATEDGALVLISIQNEREWVEFCAKFLEEPDLPHREGFQTNSSASPTAPWWMHISPPCSHVCRARGRPRNCALPTQPTASSTTWRPSRATLHCGAQRSIRRTGRFRWPRRRCCPATGRARWGRCRRSASTPRQSAPNSPPDAIRRCGAAAAGRRDRWASPDRRPGSGQAEPRHRWWAA